MAIEKLSPNIKNIFYNEDISDKDLQAALLSTDETELSDFDYVAKELYLTLNKNPNITDEEIFVKFPEYENNIDILNEAKKRAYAFGGEELKKKEKNIVLPGSSDDSGDSESETPSTSGFDVIVKNKPIVPKQRKGAMKNPDGSESTHLMMTEQLEDGSWVSFPSLFQNEDGEWVDMSQEENWENIYQEAVKREEVYEFGDDKESAIAFGEGSWKKNLEKKEDTKKSIFDPDKYRRGIISVEASGEVNYSLTSFKDKEGNPVSSAVGPYQFLYNTHADLLKSQFGVNSKEEFIGNKDAQEGLMNYMLEDKPGRYPFMARRLEKDYKKYMPEDLKFSDLVALQHFVGHGDLRKLFARVRDEKDFNPESIYETSPKGKNMTIGDYLKRYRSGYNAVDDTDATGIANPLDDPNLLAASTDLPPGDYSSDVSDDSTTDGDGGSTTTSASTLFTKQIMGPDGNLITINLNEDVSEEDLQIAASKVGVDTKTTTQIQKGIIDKVNATGEKITKKDLDILIDDFKLKYEDSKVELVNSIIKEINSTPDGNGGKLNPKSPGFVSKVTDIINRRAYPDLVAFLDEKNPHIKIKRENLESDILKIAPQILYQYYTGDILDKAYETHKIKFQDYHIKRVENRQEIYERKHKVSLRDVPYGYDVDDFTVGTREETKADKSKDVINLAYDILSGPQYDNIPEGWIQVMAEEIANKYHRDSEEYTTARDANRTTSINTYNETRETPFKLPDVLIKEASDYYESLSSQDVDVRKNIIKEKYGITILDNNTISFPESFDPKYIEELNKVIGDSDKKTWQAYTEENAMEKNIVAEGFERSLFGQAITLISDKPLHPEWGVKYSSGEELAIGVLSISTDLALPVIGRGVGAATKYAPRIGMNAKSAFLANQQKNALQTWAKSKKFSTLTKVVGGKLVYINKKVRDYNNLLTIKTAEKFLNYQKKANIVGGTLNLATWMAASDLVAQQKETHSLFDIDYAHVLKKGAEGGALGWITGRLGYATRNVQNQVRSFGWNPVITYPLNQTIEAGSIITEAVAFTGISAAGGDGGLTVKDFTHNLATILGLRTARLPMRLAKGDFFTTKNQNKGIYEFTTTAAEKELLGFSHSTNTRNNAKTDKQIYKEIEKNIHGNEKNALEYINGLPTQILGKYVYAATGSKLISNNPLDGVGYEAKIAPNNPNNIIVYNRNGQPLYNKKFNNERESIEFIKSIENGRKEAEATTILDNKLLSTESKAKLENQLETITTQEINKLHSIENKTGDQKIIANRVNEKIIEIYNNQVKATRKVTDKLQEGTGKMTIDQRNVVVSERIEEAKEIEREIKEKKELGIEDVSPYMRKLNEALGVTGEKPIEVNESNIKKLKESAKTTSQKQYVEDILKSTEALKNLPGKVIVHTNASSYQKVLDKAEKGNIAELVGGHRDIKTGDIHYNLPAMNKRTASHEPAHALTETLRSSNPEKYKKIENEVYELIQKAPEFAGVLDFINTKYEGKDVYKSKSEKKNEALVEFIARVSKGEYKLSENTTLMNNIKKSLNTVMEKLGIDYKLATNSEAVSFVNSIAKNISKGKPVDVAKTEIETKKTGIQKRVSTDPSRQNLESKIKEVKKKYINEISKIKQDVKNEKKAVNKIKKDLIGYIKGAEHLNSGIKKSVLKAAVNVNTAKKLNNFIEIVESISVNESLSSAKSNIKSLSKDIKKKLKKGLFSNQTRAVEELINKDFSSIEDVNVLNKTIDVLKDLNRRKQALINPEEIKKVSTKIEEIIKGVDKTQVSAKTIEQLNTSIEKIENKIKETTIDAKSTEGAKNVISLSRSIESLKKSLYRAELEGGVTEKNIKEFEKIKKKIIDIDNKIKGKVTDFNKQRFDLSRDILNNSTLKGFGKYEKEIVELLKETEFVDNVNYNDNLLIASINISNGVPPVNVIGRLLTEANNNRNGNKLSELMKNRVDTHAGKKKWFGLLFDRLPKNITELKNKLAVTPLSLVSEFFRAERDVKDAGLIDKVIIAPLTRAMSKYDLDVKKTLKEWNTVSNSKIGKLSNWAKGEVSGKILGIPFTSNANYLFHKKQISDTKVGVILAQIERNSGDGKNVLKEILESSQINHYEKLTLANLFTGRPEQFYLKTIYKGLPKKTVNGKEVIDINKALSQLTSREKKMIKKFRDIMDNNLMPKQNFANGVRGVKFEGVENYFPHILKPGAKATVVSNKNKVQQDWTKEIFTNNNKVAADAGKERTSTDILAIELNVNRVVSNRVKDVNRDFHFTQPINNVRELITNAKLKTEISKDKGYENYFDALSGRMRDAVGVHLNTYSSKLNSELLSPLMTSIYAASLVRPTRLVVEGITETTRVGLGASERIQDIPNTFKAVADKAASNILKIEQGAANLLNKDLKGQNIDTALETVLKITNSQFLNRYSRHDIEFGKEGGQKGLMNKAANWMLSAVDRNTLHLAFIPAFTKEFKKITGKEFDHFSVLDPVYQKKYKQAILDAAAIGDRAAAQWKNIGVKGAGTTKIRLPFGNYVDKTSESAPILTFMSNFGALETAMYQKSIRDLMAGESIETKVKGAKSAASIYGAGIAYGMGTYAAFLIDKYLVKKMIIMQSASKETDEGGIIPGKDVMGIYDENRELRNLNLEFQEEWDKAFTTKGLVGQTISNTSFLITSKYSQASRAMMMAIGGVYDSWLKTEDKYEKMPTSIKKEELSKTENFLREILGAEEGVSTAKALLKGGIYATPQTSIGGIAESMLPHLDNLMNTMINDFPEDYLAWRAKGGYFQEGKASEEHEKYKDELELENLLVNSLRLYFKFRGTALPADRMVDTYYREMMERFGYDVSTYQKSVKTKYNRFKE